MSDLISPSPPKAKDALRTIGEAAQYLALPTHVLRFWEGKFPMLKPLKRRGGYRYYRPQDMAVLGHIKRLVHEEGYTLKGAKKWLKTHKETLEEMADTTMQPAPIHAEEDGQITLFDAIDHQTHHQHQRNLQDVRTRLQTILAHLE